MQHTILGQDTRPVFAGQRCQTDFLYGYSLALSLAGGLDVVRHARTLQVSDDFCNGEFALNTSILRGLAQMGHCAVGRSFEVSRIYTRLRDDEISVCGACCQNIFAVLQDIRARLNLVRVGLRTQT